MNAPQKILVDTETELQMQAALKAQRESYIAEGEVSAATRIDRINRAIDVLVKNAESISEAMNSDFGCRPREVNLMTDVTGSIECLKHSRKHLKSWMKVEKRPSMFPLSICWVGVLRLSINPKVWWVCWLPGTSPWAWYLSPWPTCLAAGNRAMIKPSEFTPATSALIAEMVAEAFDPALS